MHVYKIHIPNVPGHMHGELQNILIAGVTANPYTQLWDSAEEADYIFLDFRHFDELAYEVRYPQKTVIVDYRDAQRTLYRHPALLYFKRSVVDQERTGFCRYPRDVVPIAYCVKDHYLNRKPEFPNTRDIDVAVFFDPEVPLDQTRNYFRSLVARFIRQEFRHLNTFVGIAGRIGEAGRSGFQKRYFDTMARARIVVTCNPDRWEGDYRLFEALSSGSLVLSDRMLTPVVHPFVDWEHLVYYDRHNLPGLAELIKGLLAHEDVRRYIADNGYAHAMQFHKASDRIYEILAQLGCAVPDGLPGQLGSESGQPGQGDGLEPSRSRLPSGRRPGMSDRRLSFMGIGAQKCGTTTLRAYLRQHPGLHFPRRQELHFFDDETQSWPAPDLDAYHRHFETPPAFAAASPQLDAFTQAADTPAEPLRQRGEITPIYLYWKPSIARIRQYNPALRLIIMLRNPMARAYSHWAMARAHDVEHLGFSEAIRNEQPRRFQASPLQDRHYSYVDRGRYCHQLERVFEHFPREQVLILRSEHFFREPRLWLPRIHEFLGVTPMEPLAPEHERKGTYSSSITIEDWHYVHEQLSADIDGLEQLLGWDCSDWHVPWF